MVWNLFETIWDYGDLLIYVNTKLNKWLGQYRFIARDFVDNFKVERLMLSLGLYHSSEIKSPQVA